MPPPLQRLLATLAGPVDDGRVADVARLNPVESEAGDAYSAVIGAVPFGGGMEAGNVGPDIRALVASRRAELVAIARALLALEEGGRLALVVPESVLDGATKAHQALRRRLIEENALRAVIRLRAGLFRPRTRAAVLVAAKGGHTGRVWFCELNAVEQIAELAGRWPEHEVVARDTAGGVRSFFVRREAIQPPAYRLGIDQYRFAHPGDPPRKPHEILHEIAGLEAEILQGIRDLVGMLK